MSIDVTTSSPTTTSHDVAAAATTNAEEPLSSCCELTETTDTTSCEGEDIDASEDDEATITDMVLVDDLATTTNTAPTATLKAATSNDQFYNSSSRIGSRSNSNFSGGSGSDGSSRTGHDCYSSAYSISNLPKDDNENFNSNDLNKNELLANFVVVNITDAPNNALAHNNNKHTDEVERNFVREISENSDGSRSSVSESSTSSLSNNTSSSSTPTTADVANVVAVVGRTSSSASASALATASATAQPNKSIETALSATQAQMPMSNASAQHQHQQQQQHLSVGDGTNNITSISEDNLSFSNATTTTITTAIMDDDLDADNILGTSSPPNTKLGHLVNLAKRAILNNQQITMGAAAPSLASSTKPRKSVDDCGATCSIYAKHKKNEMPLPPVFTLNSKCRFFNWTQRLCSHFKSSGIGEPSVYHALVVIFLEFFAWGLLTMPVISTLNQTFPDHTFLMNGLVMGIKGILSFLSAPLVGALSDIWGRKFFLLITVFFTCAPIPLMAINSWWFFAMISISGALAVTFSVVFAYVADVTTVEERSRAYGLVSATFAASLVISPALGALLMETYGDTLVAALATAIAVLDVFFILVAVPESLPEKIRPSSWGAPISWEQADPFSALRKVGSDQTILMQCVAVLLSYLPEAGQYSCIFVYLKLKMGFNSMEVAVFIAVVGTLSISVQVTLGYLMRVLGAKNTIILGLVLEMLQLLWYGLGSKSWMMWAAGILAGLGSITYPAISAFVSIHSHPDRQGAVQGMVTGMRGLCNGLGPALFGVIFYLFNVDLNDELMASQNHADHDHVHKESSKYTELIPGPPFAIGALMVILAILVALYIPDNPHEIIVNRSASEKKRASVDVQYEIECGNKSTSALAPLMRSDSMAQL